MWSNSHNLGLIIDVDLIILKYLLHLLCKLNAIHKWHSDLNDDETIGRLYEIFRLLGLGPSLLFRFHIKQRFLGYLHVIEVDLRIPLVRLVAWKFRQFWHPSALKVGLLRVDGVIGVHHPPWLLLGPFYAMLNELQGLLARVANVDLYSFIDSQVLNLSPQVCALVWVLIYNQNLFVALIFYVIRRLFHQVV